jgi:amino acid transporter
MSDRETQPLLVADSATRALNSGQLSEVSEEDDFSSNTAELEDGTFHPRRLSLELHNKDAIAPVDVLPNRSIGLAQLVVITFFITCGGPFGIEPAVGSGGATLTVVGLFAIIVLWCLPQALMSAELALLCGANGGAIVWCDRAFGGLFSFLNMCNLLFSGLCSITLSLVLFVGYFESYLKGDSTMEVFLIQFDVKIAVLILSCAVVFAGPKVTSWISFVIGVILYVPFLGMLIVLGLDGRIASVDFGKVMRDIPALGSIDYGIFVSTLVWALGGFDSVGALAGEVKGGKVTYLKGIFLTIPFSFMTYVGPAFLGLVAVPNYQSVLWTDGGYTKIAASVSSWLGIFMTVCALLAMFGQCVAGISVVARQVWSCSMLGMLPPIFKYSSMSSSGIHRPIAAVVTVGAGMFALSYISYEVLSVVFLLQRVVTLVFEYGALIRLRYLEPSAARPFQVPWPWVWGIPTAVIGFFVLFFIKNSLIWIISGSVEGVFFILFAAKYGFFRVFRNRKVTIFRTKPVAETKPLIIQTA